MEKNRLIKEAHKSEFIMPVIGTFSFAFLLYTVSILIGGNTAFKMLNIYPILNDYYTFLELFSNIVVIFLFYIFIRVVERRSFRSIGLFKERSIKDFIKGFLMATIIFVLIVLVISLFSNVKFEEFNFKLDNLISVLFILPFWFIQASSEEIFARGYALPLISAKSNKLIGIILSTLLFTILHLGNQGISILGVINISIAGIFFSLLALYSENIWSAIGFHTAWNYIQGSILGLPVSGGISLNPKLVATKISGSDILTGGKFSVEGSIIMSIFFILSIILLIYLNIKKEKN